LPRPPATQVLGRAAVFGGVTLTSPPPSGADLGRQLRRAQAVARLRHPNLVRMLPMPGGAGLSPVLGNARRLADFTLPAGTFKRFDLEQVVRLLLDVLGGLAAIHEVVTDGRAFVHGQVSPQHIYIDEHGTARLVPLLPSAKLEDNGYTAPERLAGRAVDARADVFSVGVMLWEALSGKRLFANGIAARIPGSEPGPIRLSPDARWAESLCALAERAIRLDPAARFGSALELSNALAAAAAQQLSRVDTDAWQEEAPTPVFQPRLHLPTLRHSTPPPSVVTIAPERDLVAMETVAPVTRIAEASPEVPVRRRRGRKAALGIALVALSAAGFWISKAPRSWQALAAASPWQTAPASALSPVAPALAAPLTPPLAAPASARPEASVLAPATAPVSAQPKTVAAPKPSPLVSVPTPAVPAPKPQRKAGRVHGDDYGI